MSGYNAESMDAEYNESRVWKMACVENAMYGECLLCGVSSLMITGDMGRGLQVITPKAWPLNIVSCVGRAVCGECHMWKALCV